MLSQPWRDILGGKSLLVAVAAPAEARAVGEGLGATEPPQTPGAWSWTAQKRGPGLDLVLTGVGKANAAAALASVFDRTRHGAVLNLGIAGALAGASLGQLIAASASVYADEGLQTPQGFVDCAALGFPLGPFEGNAIPGDARLLSLLAPLADLTARVATVSTCSGTDALACQVAARTGAVAEAMEGAALAHIASRLGVPFAEVRAISNTTGDRPGQRWEIRQALEAISRLIGRVAAG